MSDLVPIPAFDYACLSPGANALTLYLVGMPDARTLTVNAVHLFSINAPVSYLTSRLSNSNWPNSTYRDCSNLPYDPIQNSPFMVQMFQPQANVVPLYPNGTTTTGWSYSDVIYMSSRTYSTVGASGDKIAILAWATVTSGTPPSPKEQWVIVRQNGVTDDVLKDVPNIAQTRPMLSVGTYYTNSPNGALIVFDEKSNGIIYQISAVTAAAPIDKPAFTLQWSVAGQQAVDRNGVVLSPDAVPLDAENAAYIFDKAEGGLTAVYALQPRVSAKLERISLVATQAPVFTKTMTAMTWKGAGGLLAVYYKNSTTGIPYFNLFDPITGLWTGLGLVSPPPSSQTTAPTTSGLPNGDANGGAINEGKGSGSSLGGIVGGVVGGLVVVAIIAFFFIRKRRSARSTAYATGETSETAAAGKGVDGAKNMDDKDEYHDNSAPLDSNLTRLGTVQGPGKPSFATEENRNVYSAATQPQQYNNNNNNTMAFSPPTPTGSDYYQMMSNDPTSTAGFYAPPIPTTTAAYSPNDAFTYASPPAIPAYYQPHAGYVSPPPQTTTAAMVNKTDYFPPTSPPKSQSDLIDRSSTLPGPQYISPFQQQQNQQKQVLQQLQQQQGYDSSSSVHQQPHQQNRPAWAVGGPQSPHAIIDGQDQPPQPSQFYSKHSAPVETVSAESSQFYTRDAGKPSYHSA
ncbi:hypothetical protein BGW39_007424 [Mortierella sp. 14UC]|nr:hypothetical protein BGW39_007424 [Mortierella sp. 14UC]